MDKKTFEKQKAFAGERQPSMKRRCLDRDYRQRGMYMVTLVTEGRRKLFGDVTGRSDAEPGSAEAPRMVLSKLGAAVVRCWQAIPNHYPEVKLIKLQMMPDHLHGILFEQRKMDDHLGIVLKGFKTGCNKEYRKLLDEGVATVGCVATMLQHTIQQHTIQQHTERQHTEQKHTGHEKGLLFERNYNDRLLLREGQLQRWIDYLDDNPRRLLAKREHPDLFRVHFGLMVAGQTFAAIGNRFLLQRPWKLQVQCSRSLTQDEIAAKVDYFINTPPPPPPPGETYEYVDDRVSTNLGQLREQVRRFLANSNDVDTLPEKRIEDIPLLGERPVSMGLVSLFTIDDAPEATVDSVRHEIAAAIVELRDSLSQQLFGLRYGDLALDQAAAIRAAIPTSVYYSTINRYCKIVCYDE